MGMAEVEAFEGVGGALMELITLWKCVEKLKVRDWLIEFREKREIGLTRWMAFAIAGKRR
jgi:hypothetical protein